MLENARSNTTTPNSQHAAPSCTATRPLEGAELFKAIECGSVPVASVEVPRLFELASSLAVSGRLDLKNVVLSEWIATHPQATPVDCLRVDINSADWQRRTGHPEEGLERLKTLTLVEHPFIQVEYLQAYNQCLLQIARKTSSNEHKTELLCEAVSNQERLCDIALSSGVFAADKKFYYLVGICEHRGHLLKAQGRKSDPRIEQVLDIMEKIVQHEPMPPVFLKRCAYELPFTRAIYEIHNQRFGSACELLERAWKALQEVPDTRYRGVVAMHYLYSSMHNPERKPGQLFEELRMFYFSRGRPAMFASDKPLSREIMDFVDQTLKQ